MEDDRNTAAQRTRTEGGTQEERTERKDTAGQDRRGHVSFTWTVSKVEEIKRGQEVLKTKAC